MIVKKVNINEILPLPGGKPDIALWYFVLQCFCEMSQCLSLMQVITVLTKKNQCDYSKRIANLKIRQKERERERSHSKE